MEMRLLAQAPRSASMVVPRKRTMMRLLCETGLPSCMSAQSAAQLPPARSGVLRPAGRRLRTQSAAESSQSC